MNTKGIGAIIIIVAITGIVQIPVHQQRIISPGTDAFSAHDALFGNTGVTHDFITDQPTVGLGTILVDLYRKNMLEDVRVEVTDTKTNKLLISKTIPASEIQDDTFAYVYFKESPIPKHTAISIAFSAPTATQHNPVGLRFDQETKHVSLSMTERVPVWKALSTTMKNREQEWRYTLVAIGLALIPTLAIWAPGKKAKYIVACFFIIILALAARLWVIPQLGGVSGGDAYNYLSITTSIIQLENPFANTKRLPGYPLLLVPFVAGENFDEQLIMRTISTVASMLSLGALVALARILKLRWPVAICSMLILAFQKDFFWTSMRPEPYSVYAVLLIASLVLFFTSYQKKSHVLHVIFGLTLGYAAMTRQEGFVLAAMLGTCSLIYETYTAYATKHVRSSLSRFARMYAPALLATLPYFTNNLISYGHPLYTPYLEGDRLQIVDSFLAFQDALGATWGVIGSMWKIAWDELERLPLTSPVFIGSFFGLLLWYVLLKKLQHQKYSVLLTILALFLMGSTTAIAVYAKPFFVGNIPIITSAFVLASIPLFIHETTWRGVVVLMVLLSQIGIATWFHPFAKHYQQSFPFIVLILGTSLCSSVPKKRLPGGMLVLAATLPFLIASSFLMQKINAAIDEHNEDTALDSVAYRAARFARTLAGPVGFDQAYLPARFYFESTLKYFTEEEHATAEKRDKWILQEGIRTFVATSAHKAYDFPNPSWKTLKTFKAAGKDERMFESSIYEIPRSYE